MRYFLNLTDKDGVLIARFEIESDMNANSPELSEEEIDALFDDDNVHAPEEFGFEHVMREIDIHERARKEKQGGSL